MDGDKGEREEKAKESKTPSTPSTAVPISKGSGLKNPLREAGKQEEERETEGRGAEQKEEEQEEGLISEHLYKERKPSGTLSSPSPEGVGREIQREKEAKKRKQILRREIKDKTNKVCTRCESTFGRRRKFIQHCREKHGWRIRVKTEKIPQTPRLRDPPGQGNNTPKKSPREGGLNTTPTPEEEELRRRDQNQGGDEPNAPSMKSGALQPPWMREQKASQQPQHQTEKTREDGDASPRGEPGDRSPARKREKKETKTRAHADKEAGKKEWL